MKIHLNIKSRPFWMTAAAWIGAQCIWLSALRERFSEEQEHRLNCLQSTSPNLFSSLKQSPVCFLKLDAGTSLLFHLLWSRCITGGHTRSWRAAGGWLADESTGNVDCLISLFQWLVHMFNVYFVQLSAPLLSHQSTKMRPNGFVITAEI